MEKPKTTMQGAPMYPRGMPVSSVHFQVHPGLAEVQEAARARGWSAAALSAELTELHFSTDGCKTTHVVRSADKPPPFAPDGRVFLPRVQHGTPVVIAIMVGVKPPGG
jgi:hypothetical protein